MRSGIGDAAAADLTTIAIQLSCSAATQPSTGESDSKSPVERRGLPLAGCRMGTRPPSTVEQPIRPDEDIDLDGLLDETLGL